MSELRGLRKHENNQHALVPAPEDGMWLHAQVAEELKTVTCVYATPPMEERRKRNKSNYCTHAVDVHARQLSLHVLS